MRAACTPRFSTRDVPARGRIPRRTRLPRPRAARRPLRVVPASSAPAIGRLRDTRRLADELGVTRGIAAAGADLPFGQWRCLRQPWAVLHPRNPSKQTPAHGVPAQKQGGSGVYVAPWVSR